MKKIFLVLACYISSLFINQSCFYNEDDLYKSISTIIECYESGLKISYEANENIAEIVQAINNLDLPYFENNLKIENRNKNNFSFEDDNDKAYIKVLISGKEKKYNVDIEFIDKNELINLKETKKELNKLLKNNYRHNYFTFIKGNVKEQFNCEVENCLYDILSAYNIKNKSSILLENGLTGIFTIQKKVKINYSIMNYSNDTYLIMGSPIIFVTY